MSQDLGKPTFLVLIVVLYCGAMTCGLGWVAYRHNEAMRKLDIITISMKAAAKLLSEQTTTLITANAKAIRDNTNKIHANQELIIRNQESAIGLARVIREAQGEDEAWHLTVDKKLKEIKEGIKNGRD